MPRLVGCTRVIGDEVALVLLFFALSLGMKRIDSILELASPGLNFASASKTFFLLASSSDNELVPEVVVGA